MLARAAPPAVPLPPIRRLPELHAGRRLVAALIAVSAAVLTLPAGWATAAPTGPDQVGPNQVGPTRPGPTRVGPTRPGPARIEPVSIAVVDGPSGDQAVTIDADLYLPDGGAPPGPLPAVLSAHGFGGSKHSDAARHQLLAGEGYVVLAPSSRGFGDSTGAVALGHRDYEVADAVQLLDWLAARPEVALDAPGDPRVAIVGVSYGGALGLQVAQADQRVDAVVAFDTWHSLESALVPNYALGPAGEPAGVLKRQWAGLLFAAGGELGGDGTSAGAPQGSRCRAFVQEVCDAYLGTVATGQPSAAARAYLRRASPGQDAAAINAPTLLVQGLRDTLFPPDAAAKTASAIAGGGGEVALVWTSGGHGHPLPADEQVRLQARMLTWLDRHLRGAEVDTGPVFAYPRPGSGAAAHGAEGSAEPFVAEPFVAAEALPAPAAAPRRDDAGALALSADGTLTTDLAGARAGAVSVTVDPASPSFSQMPGLQAMEPFASRPASDPPGTFASFRTDLLEAPVTVVGVPSVEGLRFDSGDAEVVLFAKLYDEAPDGSAELVGRQVAAVRVDADAEQVAIALTGMTHRFATGHRIRLVLAAGDAAYAPAGRPGKWSVVVDPAVARLRLPAPELNQLAGPTGKAQMRPALAAALLGLGGVTAAAVAAVVWGLRRRRRG